MNLARLSVAILLAATAASASAAPAKPAPAHKAVAAHAPLHPGDVTRAQMVAEVREVFNLADTNHDGFMSRAEFAKRMGGVLNRTPPGTPRAPTPKEAQTMLAEANAAFNNVDTNHDGKLSFAEASFRPLKAFDMMDANHDGVLTVAEKAAAHRNAPVLPAGPTQDGPPQGR